jgi:hypothetical protein
MERPTEAEDAMTSNPPSSGLGTLILSIVIILGGSLAFIASAIDLEHANSKLEIDRFGYGGQKVLKIQLHAMELAGRPVFEFTEAEAIARLLLQLSQGPSSAEPGEGGFRIRLLGGRDSLIAALYVLPDGRWGDPAPRGQNPELIKVLAALCKDDWRKS